MAFDPSVISDIGGSTPDIVGGIAKGFQLKDMVDTNQLNQLKLNKEKATLADDEKYKQLAKGANLSTREGVAEFSQKLTKAGMPGRAMETMKYAQAQESGELDIQRQKVELHSAAQDIISSKVDGIWAQANAMRNEKTADGKPKYTTASIDAFIQGQLPAAVSSVQTDDSLPEPVKKTALGGMNQFLAQSQGKVTFDQLTQIEQQSKQGAARLKAMREDLQAQTGVKRQEETERHNQRMEELAARREADKPKPPASGSKEEQLRASMAALNVSFPQGARSQSAQDATIRGLINKYPDMSPDEIAQKLKTGQLSMATEKTEASVLGRREAAILPVEKSITKPGGFLDQAEQAVSAVDFPKLKAAGRFDSWTKEQESDPALTAYKAAVAELRAEYSIVLSKGGQVTDAARHEAEKVIPDLITKEQFKSIRKTVQRGIEASKGGVEESIAGVEGKETPAASSKVVNWSDLQ